VSAWSRAAMIQEVPLKNTHEGSSHIFLKSVRGNQQFPLQLDTYTHTQDRTTR
jgi:hypothetical protein